MEGFPGCIIELLLHRIISQTNTMGRKLAGWGQRVKLAILLIIPHNLQSPIVEILTYFFLKAWGSWDRFVYYTRTNINLFIIDITFNITPYLSPVWSKELFPISGQHFIPICRLDLYHRYKIAQFIHKDIQTTMLLMITSLGNQWNWMLRPYMTISCGLFPILLDFLMKFFAFLKFFRFTQLYFLYYQCGRKVSPWLQRRWSGGKRKASWWSPWMEYPHCCVPLSAPAWTVIREGKTPHVSTRKCSGRNCRLPPPHRNTKTRPKGWWRLKELYRVDVFSCSCYITLPEHRNKLIFYLFYTYFIEWLCLVFYQQKKPVKG